jgi:hypothetical protein
MLTKKELNGLKFLFRLLKGEHKDFNYIMKLLRERYAFDDKTAFEISYLYDKNYQQDGDFTNVTDPIKMSYEDYMDLPGEIFALMKALGDNNPENFEVSRAYDKTNLEVEHDGITYYIYDSWNNVEERLFHFVDYLCEEDNYGDHLGSYIFMYNSDRRIVASEASDNYVDNMTDDEIIDHQNLQDEIEMLNEIESLEEELDNTDTEDEEEIERIQQEIEDLKGSLKARYNVTTYDGLIDEAKDRIRDNEYERVYDELSEPVDYFIDNGYYGSIKELIERGPVSFDCEQVKKDYIDNLYDNEEIASVLGYDWIDEVEINNKTFYIFREQ